MSLLYFFGFSALSFQMNEDYKLVEKKLNIHLDPDCSLVKHKSEPGHTSLKFLLREKNTQMNFNFFSVQ